MKRKGVQIVSVDGFGGGWTRIGAIVEDEFYGGGLDKPPGTVQGLRYWYLVQTDGEWKITGGTTLPPPSERTCQSQILSDHGEFGGGILMAS
jgi:hypothetical protein